MELISVNDGNNTTAATTTSLNDTDQRRTGGNWPPRFISLRKYSLAICLLEALAIALILGYLLLKTPDTQQPEPIRTSSLRVYQNGVNRTSLLVGLVEGCNQRVHDITFTVKCRSSNLELCPSLKQINEESGLGQQDDKERRKVSAIISVTSKAGYRMRSSVATLTPVNCRPSEGQDPCHFKTVLSVNPTKLHQQIIGWGGALTDSSINNILSLSTNGTIQLLDDYFGQDGLRMNMIRITMGGSDFSSRFYTNKDDQMDTAHEINLMEEDVLYKIPMLKYLQEKYPGRAIKVIASMWSPPIWMKTNHHFNKGYLKGSTNSSSISSDGESRRIRHTYYLRLAMLKRSFITAYHNHRIDIWGLTVMNEPIFAVQPFLNFNTMIFQKEDYAQYVAEYLGPTMKNDNRTKDLKLIAHDDNRRYLLHYTDQVLANKEARRYIAGVATHGYIDEDYHLMDEIQRKHSTSENQPEPLFVLPTELCSGHLPFMEKATLGNWHRGIHYALDIIKGLQHSAAGWVDWNMALDTTGGPGWLGGKLDSPIIVDKMNDAYHRSPMFYVLGQFSRYIPPGSVRVETSITNDLYDYHFETVAFRDPNHDIIIVILNNNPYAIELHLKMEGKRDTGSEWDLYQIECKADSVTTMRLLSHN